MESTKKVVQNNLHKDHFHTTKVKYNMLNTYDAFLELDSQVY